MDADVADALLTGPLGLLFEDSAGGEWNSLTVEPVGGTDAVAATVGKPEAILNEGDVSIDSLLCAGETIPLSDLVGVTEL